MVEGDGVDLHGHGRHHVGRLLIEDEGVERFDVDGFVAHHIGRNEFAASLFVKCLHGGILDVRELADDAFHLFQFDAETAYFHLAVAASHKLQVARWQIAHNVARAVDAGIFLIGGERIADVDLGGLLGPVEIAARHLRAAHPQLARSAHGQAVSLRVDDVEAHVVQRFADGNVGQLLVHGKGGGEDGALGGAIAIVQGVGRWRDERGQFLAAHRQVAERVVLDARGKLVAHLRGHEGVSDTLTLEIFVDSNQVEADFFGDDVQLSSTRERGVHVHHAGIKAVAGISRYAASLAQFVVALEPVAESHEVSVLKLAALGHAGGAGCVEQNEQRVRSDGHLGRLRLGQRLDLAGEQHRPCVFIDHGTQLLGGDEQACLGVLHHEVKALFGISGVKRLIGATGLQDA